jgi:putative Mg2+ transporter-C (MgtC) family protein
MLDLGTLDLDALAKLVIACVLGGAIGLERELTKHPAGIRTHILVALGAAAFMLLGLSLMERFEDQVALDPLRVMQGVITGVGFIGAGTIMKAGLSVKGITTAASLWLASAVGLFVACDYYLLAACMTLISLCTLILSRGLSHRIAEAKGRDIE